jgi:hypothetical protein
MRPKSRVRRQALLGLAAWAAGSQAAPAEVLRVGPGRALRRIADAARVAPDGAVVEVDAGDYVADVAVWQQARLTVRSVGGPVRLVAAGHHAEGKALWVVRRGHVTVEGIEFTGVAVPDRNGAGIRLESGHLTVRRCRFLDSETGILTSNDARSWLEVEASEFGRLGAGDGLSHGLYVGAIAGFRLTACHVHRANLGHLVKSRARWNRIECNRLTDEPGGRASYELEFPNGGVAEVLGNVVEQGSDTRNAALVSYGAEGLRWADNRLAMAHNTLVNRRLFGGTFVRVVPAGVPVQLRNNLLVGPGRAYVGSAADSADSAGDWRLPLQALQQPDAGDWRPREQPAGYRAAEVTPALAPGHEYRHPRTLEPRPAPWAWPGALAPVQR